MLIRMIDSIKRLFDLREGALEKSVIIKNIKDEADFNSPRFWALVFAIGIASVGLNINSTPVIIGAMLISPLMGPVVSMGLALSTNDWDLMRRSFRNLLILTGISITVSAIYFSLTPITNAQSELLARIQPTVFDVLIAVFGGLAGFIGISRSRQTNIIPGVAIATALMPPLCTVGYGIGTMQPNFILGAFYLYLINSIFICLSSFVVATYMKLPDKEYADPKRKIKVNRIITVIIFVIVAPAIYTAYTFVDQNNFNVRSEDFVSSVFENEGYVVIYKNFTYGQNQKEIELALLSESFSDEEIAVFRDQLDDFGLYETTLTIRQNGFSLTEDEWRSALADIGDDEEKVQAVEARLESERMSFESPPRLLNEIRAINEKIENVAIGTVQYAEQNQFPNQQKIALVYTNASSTPLSEEESQVIERWLGARIDGEALITYFRLSPTVLGTSSTTENVVEE